MAIRSRVCDAALLPVLAVLCLQYAARSPDTRLQTGNFLCSSTVICVVHCTITTFLPPPRRLESAILFCSACSGAAATPIGWERDKDSSAGLCSD